MSRVIEIESTPVLESRSLVTALAGEGVVGAVIENRHAAFDGATLLTLRIANDVPELARKVLSALERAIDAHGLPLMTQRRGRDAYVVRPPAG